MLENAGRKGIVFYPENMLEMLGHLLDNKQTILFIMAIHMDSNNIIETKERFYRIVTETLLIKKSYAYKLITELNKTNAISRIEKGKYSVNPYLMNSGKQIGKLRYDYNELLEEEKYGYSDSMMPISREVEDHWRKE